MQQVELSEFIKGQIIDIHNKLAQLKQSEALLLTSYLSGKGVELNNIKEFNYDPEFNNVTLIKEQKSEKIPKLKAMKKEDK